MHHYAATILTATAAAAAIWLAHEYTEHRKRKAAQREADRREAMLTRAIETALLNATRQRAADKLQQQREAAHRMELERINADYYNKAAPLR